VDYWNHNTAYHGWIASIAARRRGDLLDVGCGDGLLLQRCSPVASMHIPVEESHDSVIGEPLFRGELSRCSVVG